MLPGEITKHLTLDDSAGNFLSSILAHICMCTEAHTHTARIVWQRFLFISL